ncbi:MAG: hypothetical protein AB8C95_13135 [Phycisphaeraceae bacterium]
MQDQSLARSRGTIALRAVCYLLSVIIFVLLTLVGVLVVMSLGPEPGDRMALMGVPMLAMPMVPCCVTLLFLTAIGRQRLKKAERFFFGGLGASFLCVFGLLFFLG